jgi:hypothetical protein
MTTERIRGSGELWMADNVITYDGTLMHTVSILEFRDDKVTHETISFGDPWEPPTRRAQWVEVIEPASARIGQAAADPPA